mgnify:CR=1 FL=1
MNNQLVVEVLTEAANRYFHSETGEAEMLVDEFNQSPEFVAGQRQGFADANNILLGLADFFSQSVELKGEGTIGL